MIRHLVTRPCLPLFAALLFGASAQAQWTAPNPVASFDKQQDGIVFHMKIGALRLQVCAPAIIHVMYSPVSSFSANTNPAIIKIRWPESVWTLQDTDNDIALQTAALKVAVDRKTGAV